MSHSALARWRRDWREHLIVLGGLAGFVVLVYLLVVLGGGALVGRTESPDLTLSILATAVVALGFERVQHRLEAWVAQLAHREAASPYDVLSHFSETVTGGYRTEELPTRMAQVLAEGTGARWAQVWLMVQDRLVPAATWPPDPIPAAPGADAPPQLRDGAVDVSGGGRRALPVRHGGELLGVLRLQEADRASLSPVEERLFAGLAAQAGLVLRSARLRAELAERLVELASRETELRASRERLVEAQDEERRRLERDIHDGAQQHLVAMAVNLRLAQTLASKSPEHAADVLRAQAVAARETIDTLTQLSRGIYPRLLGEEGLVPALRAAAATGLLDVRFEATDFPRQPRPVEAALYFCCLEALQNIAKHAGATTVTVRLGIESNPEGDNLRLQVTDDGEGFDPDVAEPGAGLTNMRDRLDAVGGLVELDTRPGRGTSVIATVPVGASALVPQRA
jgi:signal transduction histidine kinase